MKTILQQFIIFVLFLCIVINANAFSYYINFNGSGASTTVESILVRNLTKSTEITVPSGSPLLLYDVETSIDKLNIITDFATVFPNPMINCATYSFLAKKEGNTQISVFSLDGRKVTEMNIYLLQGKQTFQLELPKGVYFVNAIGNEFSYSCKVISFSFTNYIHEITYSGNISETKLQKVGSPEYKLQYSHGDLLLFKATSGKFSTIIADKPIGNKTIEFLFVECKDFDNNNYPIVKIGNRIWMAENLSTTTYRDGSLIGTTPHPLTDYTSETAPKYQWPCQGDEKLVVNYGRLYTGYVVDDSRNIAPVGWHIATQVEWAELDNYLIANGYNFDGTTTGSKIAKALASTTGWDLDVWAGGPGFESQKNNSSGFSAVPSGARYGYGFYHFKTNAGWWTSTRSGSNSDWIWGAFIGSSSYPLYFTIGSSSNGSAVRCVKDY